MKVVESVVLFLFLIYFAACLEEDLSPVPIMEPEALGYNNVDQALWPYFASFESAAGDYGFNININSLNIEGTIESIDEGNVAGTCSYSGRTAHRDVVIDQSFWNRASSLYREYIVFHELGHCILGRGHQDACLSQGVWSSLMRSGTQLGECRDFYNNQTRDYYVNELFTGGSLAP